MTELRNKRVTVAGLGHFGGGIEVARWLMAQGALVCVTDSKTADKLVESVRALDGLPIEFHLGGHRRDDFASVDLVVASPAIPPTNEYLAAAREAGVPVTTEIRLFLERCTIPVIAVTGSKGKSTTTSMLGQMLQQKYTVWVGGNIGGSLLPKLSLMKPGDLCVLELSSYMLEYLGAVNWSPHVAVVTMLTEDHLEWHGSAEAYLSAKQNIVRFQKPEDYSILPAGDSIAAQWAETTAAQVETYPNPSTPFFDLIIPGAHNQINAQGAYTAARVMNIDFESAQRAIADFKGLPHRLQLVHETDGGVRYFNDSIATIPEAAVAACESFPERHVIQIVGGSDKGLDLKLMCDQLPQHAKAVLCIGMLGDSLAGTMEQKDAECEVRRCGDLSTAMQHARELAEPGDVVLLSPGCASYDQFANFEERGERFADLARSLNV